MKKLLLLTALVSVISVSASAVEKFIVTTALIPHARVLGLIKLTLAKEGVDLQIKVFTDYVQLNVQVAEKCLDANCFQILPHLENFNGGKGTSLVTVVGVHVEPFGGYSRKYKSLIELSDGVTVVIPNEGGNSGRALLLLQKAGLLKLKDPNNVLATSKDIAENPKNLKFKELESALLPCVLDQVDPDPISTNYALEAKLNSAKDALVLENRDSPYVNYLVTHPDNKNSDALKKLSTTPTSPEVKVFIEKKYTGMVVPAFRSQPVPTLTLGAIAAPLVHAGVAWLAPAFLFPQRLPPAAAPVRRRGADAGGAPCRQGVTHE